MNCFHFIWSHLAEALKATYVPIEIAALGAVIAWLQLQYAKKRDKMLDIRNSWEKIHKAMLEFRFRRMVLSDPASWGKESRAVGLEALEALHNLKGQLDRAPDSPLVAEIANFLSDNISADKWRADEFVATFDKLAHQAALKTQ